MSNAEILIIEGRKSDRMVFSSELQKKGYSVTTMASGNGALSMLDEVSPDLIVVNAASLGYTGTRVCQSLRDKQQERVPIVLILEQGKVVDKSTADIVLNLPFTIQKLVNRLKPLLPVDGSNIIHAGPIRLDSDNRRVRCLSKNSRLTPRLVRLLHILLQHRGEVIGREDLFKQVWETEYTGDTRTLDVHVSWLRQAIEIDPTRPRFLHTVRGVGYRLDV